MNRMKENHNHHGKDEVRNKRGPKESGKKEREQERETGWRKREKERGRKTDRN